MMRNKMLTTKDVEAMAFRLVILILTLSVIFIAAMEG